MNIETYITNEDAIKIRLEHAFAAGFRSAWTRISPYNQDVDSKAFEKECNEYVESVTDSTPTIDLDLVMWEMIKEAAAESKWMPKEYFTNDWVNDTCSFLRDGYDESDQDYRDICFKTS